MKTFTSINDLHMVSQDEFNWEILKENDGTDVYRITLGGGKVNEDWLTLLYGKNTLSIRKFAVTYRGGDILFLELPFEKTSEIIRALLKGHNLTLMPLYHKDTVKIKN